MDSGADSGVKMRPGEGRLPRACQRDEHYAGPDVVVDAAGAEHGTCRACGCKLTRMSFQRRWFRTGLMG